MEILAVAGRVMAPKGQKLRQYLLYLNAYFILRKNQNLFMILAALVNFSKKISTFKLK